MKLKIYVFKKQQLVWTVAILAIIIIAAILIITIKTSQTFDFFKLSNSYKADINNDGKVDSVVAKVDDVTKGLTFSVVCSDGNGYILEPDPVIKTFGFSNDTYPYNITFNDINSDGKQEIFVQTSDSNGPILQVYKYTNNNVERIVSGRYSLYGLIDDPKDNSRLLVLCSNFNNNVHMTYLKVDWDSLTPYSASQSLDLGKSALFSFVDLMENKDVEAFSSNIDSKLQEKIVKGNLIDGMLQNVKYTEYDIPTECTYVLRTDSIDDKGQAQLVKYKVKVSLNKYDANKPEYIVSSVDKIK